MKRNEKKKVEVLFKVASRHKPHSERQPRRQEGFVSMTTSEREAKRGRLAALDTGVSELGMKRGVRLTGISAAVI